jgi:hypothetical protein
VEEIESRVDRPACVEPARKGRDEDADHLVADELVEHALGAHEDVGRDSVEAI